MNKRLLITIGLIVAILVLAFGLNKFFSSKEEAPPQSEKKAEKYFVKAAPVKYKEMNVTVKASGRVVSRRSVNLVAEVQGRIVGGDAALKKGISFKEGDILVKLFNKDMEFSLRSMKSNYMNLIANSLPDIKIDYPGAYQQWRKFFTDIDIEKPLPPLPDITDNQLKVFLASRNLLGNYYSILSQEEILKKYTISAPFDGTFTEVLLEKGAVANPGSRIASMIRTDVLEVEVPVPASDARYVDVGDSVRLMTEDEDIQFNGSVSRKAAFIDQNTQSQSIFINLHKNVSGAVYQGQFLIAIMQGRSLERAMELPRNAVFDGDKAYIVVNGKLQEHTINIHKLNDKTLLFSGLEEGIMIVNEPLINAKEGTPVEIL